MGDMGFDGGGVDPSGMGGVDYAEMSGNSLGEGGFGDAGFEGFERPPDYYNEFGDPVYLGRTVPGAKGSRSSKMKKAMQAFSGGFGGMNGGQGSGQPNSLGSLNNNNGGQGTTPIQSQFYYDRPWNLPYTPPSTANQQFITGLFKGAASGVMGGM